MIVWRIIAVIGFFVGSYFFYKNLPSQGTPLNLSTLWLPIVLGIFDTLCLAIFTYQKKYLAEKRKKRMAEKAKAAKSKIVSDAADRLSEME